MILDGAASLLDRGGLSALNTNAIARRAGVAVGSVYRNFGNKQAVFDALGEREAELFEGRLALALEGIPITGGWGPVAEAIWQLVVSHLRATPGARELATARISGRLSCPLERRLVALTRLLNPAGVETASDWARPLARATWAMALAAAEPGASATIERVGREHLRRLWSEPVPLSD